MRRDVYEEIVGKEYKLEIVVDEDAESPREWDNVGEMICFHSRYGLGDKHGYSNPRDFLEDMARSHFTEEEIVEGLLDDATTDELMDMVEKDGNFILPLYLYDHSGITMRTSPFSCQWDSGQVGWIYCSKERAEKEWHTGGLFDEEWRERVTSYLENEVAVYDQYLTGDVYGFILYCWDEECEEWVEDDSCWGFYGTDWSENGLWEHLPLMARLDLEGK